MTLDFKFTEEQEGFRKELRAFLATELPPGHWQLQNDREEAAEGYGEFVRLFRKKLAARGWLTLNWPKEYGGLGATPLQKLIFDEETGYHLTPDGGMGVMMAGPTLIHWGTPEQKAKHLSAIASAEEVWCQGFSEPGTGSDLAGLQTRAVRDGDDYVVNGQKIWTSGAHEADWCMLLTRTDPEAPKHKGVSYLLMEMGSPGITVKPLVNLMGTHTFNEIFLEDVRVPVRNLVGPENQGWYVATTTLDYERGGIGRIMWAKRMLEEMVRYAREHRREVGGTVRSQLAELWVRIEIARLLAYRVAWMQAQGKVPNAESSMVKLFGSELSQAVTNVGTNMLGVGGGLVRGSAGRPALLGALPLGYMAALSYTIAGGTSEIQRNIIAIRGLGLPRG